MTTLFIEPNDVLLFRDGRTFSATNGDHRATGLFPPLPTTFYGALRSTLLSHHEADFHARDFGVREQVGRVVGTKCDTGTLAIKRFSLALRENGSCTPCLPVPRDVLVQKEDEESYCFPRPEKELPGRTNLPVVGLSLLWPQGEDEVYKNAEGFLPEDAYLRLLSGEIGAMRERKEAEDLFQPEPRTSVQIDEKNTAEEGRLFTVDFTRTNRDVGFLVSVEDDGLLPDSGWLRLGGEARAARYERASVYTPDAERLKQKVRDTGRLKLVLATPAVFRNGWRPDDIGEDGRGTIAGCRVKLVSAAVGRYRHVGGWDLARGRPKPARRAVPAGSVYFFRLEDHAEADRLFEGGPVYLLAGDSDDRKQGLGLAYLGTY